ncbi:hypothetical protein [Streptacidiphilus albus]|uniref:hypothetical protein n=1 Tax=Streptacidiphilus albus TaxID=105425 RepID=UPI00054B14FF|nr:hypothetical protein [Streptacidiphilus albus]
MSINPRVLLIALLTIVCLGCLFCVYGSYQWDWRFHLPVHDDTKMALINTVAVLAALIVAVLAGIVAIIAYAAASGQAKLKATVTFGTGDPNSPDFALDAITEESAKLWPLSPTNLLWGQVLLENSSAYAARNPGVRIRFDGLVGALQVGGWESVKEDDATSVTEIQWDGGADRMIHGKWSRTLPRINLAGASWLRSVQRPTMTVTVVADGVSPKPVTYQIELRHPEEPVGEAGGEGADGASVEASA